MKRTFIITALFLFATHFLVAQSAPYRVVFDITSKDTVDHKMVIRVMNEVLNASPDAKLEVVFYGKSLDMVVKDKSIVTDAVAKLLANKNVAFRVCTIAMKNNNVDNSQLLPGVGTVPDGIYELVSKQQEGWGYIKISH